ncbi:hypothetical protein H0H81_005464 [Sphagnurus paluster]|uniref:Berberine/berberine-like domain-containing protein n=1 Tax=Sphagnurus paluster TaxID=117069 RepID=A0A9P7GKK0_9AGAR|nr:hypothetical protein H0H81_005464 [Sphagnurus paluster]
MEPLVSFGNRLQSEGVKGTQVIVTEFPSSGTFYDVFSRDLNTVVVGSSLALASRLITIVCIRSALVSGLHAADATTPGLIILLTAPSSFPSNGETSMTEAWRSSIYHVTVYSPWDWDATMDGKKQRYNLVSRSVNNLRKITPDAAYLNEADVYEPNYKVAFWGNKYDELLRIKEK